MLCWKITDRYAFLKIAAKSIEYLSTQSLGLGELNLLVKALIPQINTRIQNALMNLIGVR